MKKILLAILLAISLCGWEVDASAADTSWYSDALLSAKTATGKVKVDGFLTAGKLFTVDHETIGTAEEYKLRTEAGSWFVKGEIGVLYERFRPFIAYETLTNSYDQKVVGLDIFLFEKSGVALGLRNAYMVNKVPNMNEQGLIYSGILLKF